MIPGRRYFQESQLRIVTSISYRDYVDRTAFGDFVISYVLGPADERILLGDIPHAKYVARSRIFANGVEKVLYRKGKKNLEEKPRIAPGLCPRREFAVPSLIIYDIAQKMGVDP